MSQWVALVLLSWEQEDRWEWIMFFSTVVFGIQWPFHLISSRNNHILIFLWSVFCLLPYFTWRNFIHPPSLFPGGNLSQYSWNWLRFFCMCFWVLMQPCSMYCRNIACPLCVFSLCTESVSWHGIPHAHHNDIRVRTHNDSSILRRGMDRNKHFVEEWIESS